MKTAETKLRFRRDFAQQLQNAWKSPNRLTAKDLNLAIREIRDKGLNNAAFAKWCALVKGPHRNANIGLTRRTILSILRGIFIEDAKLQLPMFDASRESFKRYQNAIITALRNSRIKLQPKPGALALVPSEERDRVDFTSLDFDMILNAICEPVINEEGEIGNSWWDHYEAIMRWTAGMDERAVFNAIEPEEIEQAADWMAIVAGRDIKGDPKLDRAAAIEIGARGYGVPHMRFIDALRLWRQFPGGPTVAGIKYKARRISMSVVLPLKRTAYERIRAGEIRELDLTLDDLQEKSRWIWLAALARRPADEGGLGRGWKELEQFGMSQQVAHLADIEAVSLNSGEEEVRFLCGAFIPSNTRRLTENGFLMLGTKLKGTDAMLMEFVYRSPSMLDSGLVIKSKAVLMLTYSRLAKFLSKPLIQDEI